MKRGGIAGVVVLYLALCNPVGIADSPGVETIEEGLAAVASHFVERLAQENRDPPEVSIAVVPFVDIDGVAIRRLGVEAASVLSRHLTNANKPWLRVTDRLTLNAVLQEQKLWISDIVRPIGSATRDGTVAHGSLGGMIDAAQYLVVGMTSDAGPDVILELKLIITKTGRPIMAEKLSVPKSAAIRALMWYVQRPAVANDAISVEVPPIQLTWVVIGLHRKTSGGLEDMVMRDGTILNSGDMFQVQFTPLSDCYSYLILFGSDGSPQLLFPHAEIQMDNYCSGGVTYVVPDRKASKSRWFWLDDKPGTEILYLVASYEPMNNLGEVMRKMEEASSGPGPDAAEIRNHIQAVGATTQTPRGVYVLKDRSVGGVSSPEEFQSVLPDDRRIQIIGDIIRGEGAVVRHLLIQHQ